MKVELTADFLERTRCIECQLPRLNDTGTGYQEQRVFESGVEAA